MTCAVFSSLVFFSLIIFTCADGDDSVLIGRFEMISKASDPAYNEYLEALGYNAELRQVIVNSPITLEITKEDGKYTLTTNIGSKSQSRTIQPGVEVEETLLDGRKCKLINHIYGAKIVHVLTCGNMNSIGIAEFTKEGITFGRSAKDKSVSWVFKRV